MNIVKLEQVSFGGCLFFWLLSGGETSKMPELSLTLLIMKVEMSKMLLFWMTLLILRGETSRMLLFWMTLLIMETKMR